MTENKAWYLYKKRRKKRLTARDARFDADEGEEASNVSNSGGKKGGHGNTRLPYGLCKREGIEVQEGWAPKDAWKALEGKGISAKEEYKKLQKKGKKEKTAKISPEEAKKITTSYNDTRKAWKTARNDLEKDRKELEKAEMRIEGFAERAEIAEEKYNRAKEEYDKIKTSDKPLEQLEKEYEDFTKKSADEIKFLTSLTLKPPEEGTKEREKWEKTILDNAEEATSIKRPEPGTEEEAEWERIMLGTMRYDIGYYVREKNKDKIDRAVKKADKMRKQIKALEAVENAEMLKESCQEYIDDAKKGRDTLQARIAENEKKIANCEKELNDRAEEYKNAVNSAFPTYDDCNTYDDLEDKLRANGCLGRDKEVYFGNIGMTSAKMTAKAFGDFYDKVPSMQGNLGGIEATRMDSTTYAGSHSNDIVYLNSDRFGNPEQMKRSFEQDVEKKFHPEGVGYEGIIYHELAHQMDSYLTQKLRADDINEIWFHRKNMSTIILDEVAQSFGKSPDDIKPLVSFYATKRATSIDSSDDQSIKLHGFYNGKDLEFFAEAISEYLCSPSPRQVAVKTWEVLQKYLKQAEEMK